MTAVIAQLTSPKRHIELLAHGDVAGWFLAKQQGPAREYLRIISSVESSVYFDLAKMFPEIFKFGKGWVTAIEYPKKPGGDFKYIFLGSGVGFIYDPAFIELETDPEIRIDINLRKVPVPELIKLDIIGPSADSEGKEMTREERHI